MGRAFFYIIIIIIINNKKPQSKKLEKRRKHITNTFKVWISLYFTIAQNSKLLIEIT